MLAVMLFFSLIFLLQVLSNGQAWPFDNWTVREFERRGNLCSERSSYSCTSSCR